MQFGVPPGDDDTPPLQDTPEKRQLRKEIAELHQTIDETRSYANYAAETVLRDQRAGFERTAEAFEQQARDVTEAEVSRQRAL